MQRTPEMRELVTMIRDKLLGNSAEIEVRIPHSNPELELFDVWMFLGITPCNSTIRGGYRIRSKKINCRCCDSKVCHPVKGRNTERNFFSIDTPSDGPMDPNEILEQMMDIIERMEEEFNSLMIEKRTGAFVNTRCEKAMDDNKMIDLVTKAFAHAEYNPYGEPCCVCKSITETKTRCGHHLCMHCWNSLERPVCPLCREDVDEFGGSDCESDDDD